ncbi:hypothetical protein LAZ67_X001061, partial [Cordylochernes scorpioides]
MEAGQSQIEVAKWPNVNKSVVSKIWKQFIETGTIKGKEGSGRKRKTATSEDRYLVVTTKRHREMTAIQLSNELSSATGTRISRQTVYRRLHEGALYARRPMRGSLLVWAGNSSSRRTPLHIFSGGTLTAQRYRDEILEPYLRPYRDQISHNLILMDDNARPHRARLVNEYLQSENIRRMDWRARSPDLNPIEHVWDALGRRIGARHPSPRTLIILRRKSFTVSFSKKFVANTTTSPIANTETSPIANTATSPVANKATSPVANPATSPVANTATSTVSNTATSPVANPATSPVANPETSPVANTATSPVANPVTSPVANPATSPVANTATSPVANTATSPVANKATSPVANPATSPVANTATSTVSNTVTSPVANPATSPVANPATSPVANPVTSPVANTATSPVANPVTSPVANPATSPVANTATSPVANTATYPVNTKSRFCLSSDSRRVRVWRRRGERSNSAAIVERPTVRQRGIMVWGAIAYDYRSPLLRIQGTMTAQRYVDDVLRPVTLPYLQRVPNALYQQDNARPHTARISQQALQDVQMLPWLPYSPDLSPIEHVWDIIGRRLHALPQPRSEDELWQMVEREWRAIPQDAIRTLIDSLPRRVAACIAVR